MKNNLLKNYPFFRICYDAHKDPSNIDPAYLDDYNKYREQLESQDAHDNIIDTK